MATRIGISGWTYPPWRGVFYPPGLPHVRELAFASSQFNSIEINGTFYALPRPTACETWRSQTPAGFLFAIKANRFITHTKRLRDAAAPLANFLASGLLRLGEKLGPILWQLPPTLKFDEQQLSEFLTLLPHDSQHALDIARRHEDWLGERVWLHVEQHGPLRHALEVRHASFANPACIALLRRHRVALVVADTAGKWPLLEDITSDFVYVRLHGDEKIYVSGYTDPALDFWAARIHAWRQGQEPADARRVLGPSQSVPSRDVYVYFDNDVKVRAPLDAQGLMRRLDVRWPVR